MSGIGLLRLMPPKLTAWLFYYAFPVFLMLRFLLGTVVGVFILSVLLYWITWFGGNTKPYTLPELALWIDGLPSEAKTSIATSVLTVVGFLIAFHTATANWKAEAVAHLKASIAGEIELFFNEAARLSTDADIYIRSLISAVNSLQASGATPEVVFEVKRAIEQAPKFLSVRDRLSSMSVEVHRISGRHYTVLSTILGATKALEDCASSFAEITQMMWIHVPNIPGDPADLIERFVAQVDVTECTKFVDCYNQNFQFINGTTGGIRGDLLAPLVGVNISSLISLYGKRSEFVEALSKVRSFKSRDD